MRAIVEKVCYNHKDGGKQREFPPARGDERDADKNADREKPSYFMEYGSAAEARHARLRRVGGHRGTR